MFRLTSYSWFSICCFAGGVLLGSIAIGYLTLSQSPVPLGAQVISLSMAISPVCLGGLFLSILVPAFRWLLAPVLFLGGVAIPLDFAFACLLGFADERTLQFAIAVLMALSMVALAILLEGRFSTVRVNNVIRVSITQPNAKASGAVQP